MSEGAVSAERARSILDDLIRSRERLQADGSDTGLLEATRLGIVYWQWQLSRALASEHRRSEAAA